jgi:peptidyl-prolyl cis-trans isomerase SurA
MKSRFVWISLSLCLLSPAVRLAQGAIVERVIAKVNGEIITLSDFEERQVAALHAASVPREEVSAFLQKKSADILEQAIEDVLLSQKAEELGIRIRPDALDQVLEDIKKENKIESDAEFAAQLAREGMTLEGLRRNIARSISKRRVISREVESKAMVSEEELRAEYERSKEKYRQPATVRLQEIVLKLEGPATRTRADALVARSRAGEDFAELARQNSAASTAKNGGDLGFLVVEELHTDLRRVVSGLKPGETGDPITLGGAVRILRLAAEAPSRTISYEEARGQILDELRHGRIKDEYERYVAELRKSAVIDLRVREVPHSLSLPVTTEPGILQEEQRRAQEKPPVVQEMAPADAPPPLEWTEPEAPAGPVK